MFRNIIFTALFMVSGAALSDDILSPNTKPEQFNENDKQTINHFCTEYKANILKSMDLVNTANVSPSTFAVFITNSRTNLVPANEQFLKELRERGADSCTGF